MLIERVSVSFFFDKAVAESFEGPLVHRFDGSCGHQAELACQCLVFRSSPVRPCQQFLQECAVLLVQLWETSQSRFLGFFWSVSNPFFGLVILEDFSENGGDSGRVGHHGRHSVRIECHVAVRFRLRGYCEHPLWFVLCLDGYRSFIRPIRLSFLRGRERVQRGIDPVGVQPYGFEESLQPLYLVGTDLAVCG